MRFFGREMSVHYTPSNISWYFSSGSPSTPALFRVSECLVRLYMCEKRISIQEVKWKRCVTTSPYPGYAHPFRRRDVIQPITMLHHRGVLRRHHRHAYFCAKFRKAGVPQNNALVRSAYFMSCIRKILPESSNYSAYA